MLEIAPAELELTVLSSLTTAEAVRRAEDAGICEDSFQVDAHAKAWVYILGRAMEGYSVTSADLRAACKIDVIVDLKDDSTFVEELSRVTLTRQTRAAIIANISDLEKDPSETIHGLIGALNGVTRGGKGRTMFFDGDAEDRLRAFWERRMAFETGRPVGTLTGLPCFDDEGDTWQDGEVCAIIGPLNVGKSTLLFWMAAHTYFHSHKKLLILSPESTVDEVNAKLDATIGGWMGYDLSVRGIRHGTQDPEVYDRYIKELMMAERRELVVRDSGSQGVFGSNDITSLVREHQPDVLVIDGFHLLKGKGDSWEKMKEAAETVKGLSQSTGMITIVTSQVNRSALLEPDATAGVGQSAYGLALAEAADRIISLAEKRGVSNQRVFKVPKMRGAPKINMTQYLSFDVDRGDIQQVRAGADLEAGGDVTFE